MWEAQVSGHFHSKGIALLVSPIVLRQMGCGQIDVSVLIKKNKEKIILVIEAKSGKMGPTKGQRRRLNRSLELLSLLTGLRTKFLVVHKNDAL